MTRTNATVSHQERTTATMIVATTASWSTARTDAVARALEIPKRPSSETTTAMPTSTTRATARPQPTVTDAPFIRPPSTSASRAGASSDRGRRAFRPGRRSSPIASILPRRERSGVGVAEHDPDDDRDRRDEGDRERDRGDGDVLAEPGDPGEQAHQRIDHHDHRDGGSDGPSAAQGVLAQQHREWSDDDGGPQGGVPERHRPPGRQFGADGLERHRRHAVPEAGRDGQGEPARRGEA